MSAVRRGASGLSGILLIDKPSGMTSHDVVNRVRRATGERRVGHAGTLDPLATGLLVVLVGPATRLAPYLSGADKSYLATIRFGETTDTDDADGAVTASAPVPAQVFSAAYASGVLGGVLGESMQRPPAYSAVKVDGKVAHRVARSGGEIELAERPITVSEATLVSADEASGTWTVRFRVSKGGYIRSLARDIGEQAGCGAHLIALRRVASGSLSVDDAVPLDQVEAAGAPMSEDMAGRATQPASDAGVAALFADPVAALGMMCVEVAPRAIADGRSIPVSALGAIGDTVPEPGEAVGVLAGGRFAAVYRRRNEKMVAEVVLAVPIGRAS